MVLAQHLYCTFAFQEKYLHCWLTLSALCYRVILGELTGEVLIMHLFCSSGRNYEICQVNKKMVKKEEDWISPWRVSGHKTGG